MSNVAASVRARLLNVAKTQGADFNQVLVRFALERILYRLSQNELGPEPPAAIVDRLRAALQPALDRAAR